MVPQPRVGIVMAGGSGERFWPLSTGNSPKQLLKLTHPVKNMLEEAVERLRGVVDEIFISTTSRFVDVIASQGVVEADHIFVDPAKRNTLGALVWVAAELESRGLGDSSVAVVTADHYIGDIESFRKAIGDALWVARAESSLVTLGVHPTRPETGYGYIELDGRPTHHLRGGSAIYRSKAFREKPDLETAYEYLATGNHLWNSGMFFFTLSDFRRELTDLQPESARLLDEIIKALERGEAPVAQERFESLPNLSIDYAVMERIAKLFVLPVSFPWDDVGAWDALDRTGELTEHGNSVRGDPILIDVSDSVVVQSDSGIQVSVLGVSNLIVVSTGNAVLVCHKSQAQRVRELAQISAEKGF